MRVSLPLPIDNASPYFNTRPIGCPKRSKWLDAVYGVGHTVVSIRGLAGRPMWLRALRTHFGVDFDTCFGC